MFGLGYDMSPLFTAMGSLPVRRIARLTCEFHRGLDTNVYGYFSKKSPRLTSVRKGPNDPFLPPRTRANGWSC